MVRQLGFIKNLYQGDTLGESADREGKSQPTGARWAERWNDGGRRTRAGPRRRTTLETDRW
jgi:transposase